MRKITLYDPQSGWLNVEDLKRDIKAVMRHRRRMNLWTEFYNFRRSFVNWFRRAWRELQQILGFKVSPLLKVHGRIDKSYLNEKGQWVCEVQMHDVVDLSNYKAMSIAGSVCYEEYDPMEGSPYATEEDLQFAKLDKKWLDEAIKRR